MLGESGAGFCIKVIYSVYTFFFKEFDLIGKPDGEELKTLMDETSSNFRHG